MARLLRARIARHAARAEVFASAYTAAALRGDFLSCGYFRQQRDQAAYLRDQLQARLQEVEGREPWFHQRHIVWRFAVLFTLIFWFGVFLSFHN